MAFETPPHLVVPPPQFGRLFLRGFLRPPPLIWWFLGFLFLFLSRSAAGHPRRGLHLLLRLDRAADPERKADRPNMGFEVQETGGIRDPKEQNRATSREMHEGCHARRPTGSSQSNPNQQSWELSESLLRGVSAGSLEPGGSKLEVPLGAAH